MPPQVGDGPDYDAIAFQLVKGNGFSVNWDDPDYRAPYMLHNETGEYNYLPTRHGASPTAYRPFLFPALMAISYKLLGRRFGPVRIMNTIFVALATMIAFMIVARGYGVIPGFFCTFLLVFVDPRFRFTASLILADALACLLLAVMAWCLLRTVESSSRRWAVALGLSTGFAFLAKSVFFSWMPLIAIAVFLLTRSGKGRWFSLASLRLPLLFIAGFFVVATPWMIRNCWSLRRFEPLGTMGAISLSAAYSDKAIQMRGSWFSPAEFGFFDQLPLEGKSPLEQEKMLEDRSRSDATRWILHNPLKVPLLAYLRIRNEWEPRGTTEAGLLGFAFIGFVTLWSSCWREAVALLSLLAACTAAVAVTWSADGRFLIPVLPILMILSSLGVWSLIMLTENQVIRLTEWPAQASLDKAQPNRSSQAV